MEDARPNIDGLIEARRVSKAFASNSRSGEKLEVITDLDLRVDKGKLITVFGPNGCGKTTLLNLLAGVLEPDQGSVRRLDSSLDSLSVGYVFQNHADTLLPWRTVSGNIAFPLQVRGVPKVERINRINERLAEFHLVEHERKFIYQLSGGLKQLVSIARATVYDPRLLILDEPFSALDYSLSRKLWTRFREFWVNRNVATVFVSHNIDEAVFLGDRIVVLSARPARVVAEIESPFGEKRSLDLLTSEDFFRVRNQVLEAFEDGRQV